MYDFCKNCEFCEKGKQINFGKTLKDLHERRKDKSSSALCFLIESFSSWRRSCNLKVPFVGHYSKIAKLKLRQLTKQFCKSDQTIKLVFTSSKIKNMFSVKDRTPVALKSMVVYQFACAGCNSSWRRSCKAFLDTLVDNSSRDCVFFSFS